MAKFTDIAKSLKRQQIGSQEAEDRQLEEPMEERKTANICVKVTPSERAFFLARAKETRRSMASVMYEGLVNVYGQPEDA